MKNKLNTEKTLNVLSLEDTVKDFELICEQLTDAGYNFNITRVERRDVFESSIRGNKYDIILADFKLPGFDAFGALSLCNEICPEVPFICVSGSIGEETAIELIKQGAADYVLKDKPKRLPFAIKLALEKAKEKETRILAEEALKASETSYRRLFESAKDGILILNAETGNIKDVNPFLTEMLGYSHEQLINKAIWDIGSFKDIIANKAKFIELQQKEYVRYEDLPLETSSGKKIDVEFVSNVYSVNSHNVIQCNIRDITERKKIEKELRKSEELFKNLFRYHAAIKLIIDPATGNIMDANEAAVNYYGWPHDRITRMKIHDINTLPPDDTKKAMEEVRINKKIHFEFRHRRADGSIRDVDVFSSSIIVQGKELLHSIIYDVTERIEAKKALQESERFAINTINALDNNVAILDENGVILAVNNSWRSFNKLNNGDPARANEGINYIDVCVSAKGDNSEGAAEFAAGIRSVISGIGNHYTVEYPCNSPDTNRWFFANITRFQSDGPVRIVISHTDITERKLSEEKIIKLNRTYAVLSEINKTIVRTKDQQKLFEEACKIAVETGSFKFCWIGLVDIEHDCVTPVAQCGFSERFLETINISLSSDKPESYGPTGTALRERKYNVCNDTKNDKRILPWREEALKRGYYSTASFPLFMSGDIYGVIVFNSSQVDFFDEEEIRLLEELSSDISYCSEMLDREKQKQKAEKDRDRFFNNSIDMMCIIGFDGYFRQLNPAWEKTLGWTNEELTAKPYMEFLHPEDLEITGKSFDGSITKGEIKTNIVNRFLCKDGSYKWLSWNSITLIEEKIVFAVTRDVTEFVKNEIEKKKLEAQLVQAQKLESLGTMAGGIAHDFNNILNIIMGYASLLKADDNDVNEVQKEVDIILDASKRGAGLIKQLLTFARKSESVFQTVQVNDIVNEIQKLLKETFPKTIEINFDLQKDLPVITADSTQIHQIFLNLCVNARDAMQNAGKLTLTTKHLNEEEITKIKPDIEPGEYIEIQVQDTGSGIDETVKQKIFDPFFTTKEKGKGTGLGLALVYGIVKSHGGFIDLTSEIGRGTTFFIYLPVQIHSEAIYVADTKVTEVTVLQGEGTVLVIEDENRNVELLATLLVHNGYKVIAAYDGLQGITAYQNHRSEIAVVISDIGLPKMGGEDVFKQIKGMNPEVKFILTSGFMDPELKARLQEQGVRYFVQKPYLPEEILRTVKQILEEKE